MELTVMTYNIAGGRDHHTEQRPVRPEAAAEVIGQYRPDICGLNEVDFHLPRSGSIDMAKVIADAVGGYRSFFARAVTWEPGQYGNGFLTRQPLLTAEVIPIPDPEDKSEPAYYETRCILHAVVEFGKTPVHVLATHFGLAKTEQQSAVETLLPLIDAVREPLIVMGDLNVFPDNPLLDPIRARLTDTFTRCADPNTKTFPAVPYIQSEGHPEGVKIDYIFVSHHFTVRETVVPQAVASDHRPYLTKLILPERN